MIEILEARHRRAPVQVKGRHSKLKVNGCKLKINGKLSGCQNQFEAFLVFRSNENAHTPEPSRNQNNYVIRTGPTVKPPVDLLGPVRLKTKTESGNTDFRIAVKRLQRSAPARW
jgi:hypothetical protein